MNIRTKVAFGAFAVALAIILSFISVARGAEYHFTLPTDCTVNGASTLNGTCDPPSSANCTTGTASDVPGYTAICSGSYLFHSGGLDTTKGPSQYTFEFVFGTTGDPTIKPVSWPGAAFGASRIFTVGTKQYISVPIDPSVPNTVSINENQTYTSDAITFSVSTIPGRFANGLLPSGKPCMLTRYDTQCKPNLASGVVCAQTNNPALKLSSNGNTSAQCKLDPTKKYWFNALPAKYATAQGIWVSGFSGPSAKFGMTLYSVN